MKIRFWLLLSLLIPITGMAATKYVTDHLVITLRTGQGNQFQIVKTLPSGSQLTVLQETDTGYAQVRTSDGTEGWVRTQYLSDDPPAAEQLAAAQDKLSKVQDKLNKVQLAFSDLRKEKNQLASQHSKLLSENKATSEELAKLTQIAAHPKQLESENIDLRAKFAKMSDEFNLLKQENQVLKDRSKRNWFLAGALVVIIGIIIGLIIPKLRFRRKDSWDF